MGEQSRGVNADQGSSGLSPAPSICDQHALLDPRGGAVGRVRFGEDALANVSLEKGEDGAIAGHVRIRSKTQGIALSLGDKVSVICPEGGSRVLDADP